MPARGAGVELLAKFGNVLPAVELDASQPFAAWPAAVSAPSSDSNSSGGPGSFALVYSSNVIHIAPWSVAAGIFASAGVALRPGGSLIFHGPFKVKGECANEETALFDVQMAGNSDGAWGVREIQLLVDEAAKCG